jgi:hypothetical protein
VTPLSPLLALLPSHPLRLLLALVLLWWLLVVPTLALYACRHALPAGSRLLWAALVGSTGSGARPARAAAPGRALPRARAQAPAHDGCA